MFNLGEFLSGLLRNADFLATFDLESDTSRLLGLWIERSNVGNVDGLLHFNDLTWSGSLFLDVLFDDVDTFYDDSLGFLVDRKDLALLAFVFSGDDSYDISAVNFHSCYLFR